jgi:hypothetical protein
MLQAEIIRGIIRKCKQIGNNLAVKRIVSFMVLMVELF